MRFSFFYISAPLWTECGCCCLFYCRGFWSSIDNEQWMSANCRPLFGTGRRWFNQEAMDSLTMVIGTQNLENLWKNFFKSTKIQQIRQNEGTFHGLWLKFTNKQTNKQWTEKQYFFFLSSNLQKKSEKK